ncbi:hypothetical protein L3Q82_004206 [Scortum barcoo]|uniref:Uncharacterized protein n=1 Tax=Scortum barcoo TaxID=214431 RepID=A0ACB8VJU8_9TELE|nr:hypothetical protein L3Q82_004206 [Scortum barcoo]
MIQSANSHVRRLMGEKAQHEEEMERAKETFKNALMSILTQCKDTFYFTVRHEGNFLSSQELRNAHSEEIMGIRREEEMEMSDDDSDESPCKRIRTENGVSDQTQASLREENDSLRWQLDAYRNEAELLRKEQSKTSREDEHTQTHTLSHTLTHTQS